MIRETRGMGAEKLVVIVLVIFVLVFMASGFSRLMTGHWIPNFIPSFNYTGEGKSELSLVRYVITEDRLDYYDGANWRAFGEAPRELNEKVYEGTTLRSALRAHYFDSGNTIRGKGGVTFPSVEFEVYTIRFDSILDRSYEEGRSWWEAKWVQDVWHLLGNSVEKMERGDVVIELWKRSGTREQLHELYVLRESAGEIIRITRGEGDVLDENVVMKTSVRQKALAWREGVFKKPVRVSYQNAEGDTLDVYVCLQRTTGSNDLVADLDKDVSSTGTCGSTS